MSVVLVGRLAKPDHEITLKLTTIGYRQAGSFTQARTIVHSSQKECMVMKFLRKRNIVSYTNIQMTCEGLNVPFDWSEAH